MDSYRWSAETHRHLLGLYHLPEAAAAGISTCQCHWPYGVLVCALLCSSLCLRWNAYTCLLKVVLASLHGLHRRTHVHEHMST